MAVSSNFEEPSFQCVERSENQDTINQAFGNWLPKRHFDLTTGDSYPDQLF